MVIRKIKNAFLALKTGGFRLFFAKLIAHIRMLPYRLRARYEDWRIGRMSLSRLIPSRYQEAGAYSTQSADYRMLDAVFESLPLNPNDVFIDAGCGEGRVLTYLYLRKFRGKLIGIELDPDVAETARKRTVKCPNITILCDSVLNARETVSEATVLFLYNPFNETVLQNFITIVEESCSHPVTLYYCHDLYRNVLDKRDRWQILRRNILRRPCMKPLHYSIYRFTP